MNSSLLHTQYAVDCRINYVNLVREVDVFTINNVEPTYLYEVAVMSE